MKYIRQEHLITTVCNENVYDEEIIKKLLNKIKSDSIYFSISYRNEVNYIENIINYNRQIIGYNYRDSRYFYLFFTFYRDSR